MPDMRCAFKIKRKLIISLTFTLTTGGFDNAEIFSLFRIVQLIFNTEKLKSLNSIFYLSRASKIGASDFFRQNSAQKFLKHIEIFLF